MDNRNSQDLLLQRLMHRCRQLSVENCADSHHNSIIASGALSGAVPDPILEEKKDQRTSKQAASKHSSHPAPEAGPASKPKTQKKVGFAPYNVEQEFYSTLPASDVVYGSQTPPSVNEPLRSCFSEAGRKRQLCFEKTAELSERETDFRHRESLRVRAKGHKKRKVLERIGLEGSVRRALEEAAASGLDMRKYPQFLLEKLDLRSDKRGKWTEEDLLWAQEESLRALMGA